MLVPASPATSALVPTDTYTNIPHPFNSATPTPSQVLVHETIFDGMQTFFAIFFLN